MCGMSSYNVPSHNENHITGPTVSKKLGLVSGPKGTVQEYFAPFFMFRVLKISIPQLLPQDANQFFYYMTGRASKEGPRIFDSRNGRLCH